MRSENKRDLYLKIRVSQEEMNAIKKKFQNSGMNTLSGFVRAMIFEGYIVHIDENELKELRRLANNIANNINQIAHRVNSTHNLYKEDIEEIKHLANQLWKPLLFLQSKVLQLKH
ncbi:MAG: plasmid mobilization relaxosome protein MobC [Clostridium sp.]|nr:plasmid mobilization relaxosome protein MobC [Clostridium sp.]